MTAEQIGVGGPWVGCVVGSELGVARVLTDGGEVRASYGGGFLAAIARDRSLVPEPGDWVVLRAWCDGRVTIEGRWCARPRPLASVIAIDRPYRGPRARTRPEA